MVSMKGGAYIYSRGPGGAWVQTSKISHTDAGLTDAFGTSVCINHDTDTVVVSAPGRNSIYQMSIGC